MELANLPPVRRQQVIKMATDHIRYDILAQNALRGVVRDVLTDAAKNGLPGEHHFYISFDTTADGVQHVGPAARAASAGDHHHPAASVLGSCRHRPDHFEVGLSFHGVPEKLVVPFDAIKGFFDPSVQFGLQFETIDAGATAAEAADEQSADGERAQRIDLKTDHASGALARSGQSGSRHQARRSGVRQTRVREDRVKSFASTVSGKNNRRL